MNFGGARAEKQRIRNEIRIRASALTEAYTQPASQRITEQVLSLQQWRDAQTVMAYVSLPGEPDTGELILQALAAGKTLLLPRCIDGHRMEALPVRDPAALVPGRLGIPEPPEAAEGTPVPEPDLILVPCVSAAPSGIRLGHGAGYYDRFLDASGAYTVCLCFRALMSADLPAEETDIRMDCVITD